MARSIVVEEAPPSTLVSLAKAFNEADRVVVELEEKVKTAKHKRKAAEKKLVDEMTTQAIRSFRTPFGGFRSEAAVYPNVVDKEALGSYLVKNKKKLQFLFTTSVHGGKLKSYVKEVLQNGGEMPDGVDPYTEMVVRRFA